MKIHVDVNNFITGVYLDNSHVCNYSQCLEVGEEILPKLSDSFELPLLKYVSNIITEVTDPMDYYIDPILWARYVIKGREEYSKGNIGSIPLNLLKQYKIEELASACQTTIYEGFTSSGYQGTPHDYTFDTFDQSNITGLLSAINSGLNIIYKWKSKTDSVLQVYTAQEVKDVAKDAYDHVESKRTIYHLKKTSVLVCTTAEEVLAITWEG